MGCSKSPTRYFGESDDDTYHLGPPDSERRKPAPMFSLIEGKEPLQF